MEKQQKLSARGPTCELGGEPLDVRTGVEMLVSRRLDDGCLGQGGVVMWKLPKIEDDLE